MAPTSSGRADGLRARHSGLALRQKDPQRPSSVLQCLSGTPAAVPASPRTEGLPGEAAAPGCTFPWGVWSWVQPQVVGWWAPPPHVLLFSAPLADRAPAWRTSLGLISCLDTEWFD